MSQEQPVAKKRPFSEAFINFIPQNWAPYSDELPELLPNSMWAPARRDRISAMFPGERIVIPAGGFKVRNDDNDYRFRPETAFAHLTGLGTDREPDSCLVLEPTDHGHDATLFFMPRSPRTDRQFYADSRYGEMWVGQRESLDEMSAMCGISCSEITGLKDALAKDADSIQIRVLRHTDAQLTATVDEVRQLGSVEHDQELATALSELRLVKDEWEREEMRNACRQTFTGFEAVIADLPRAVKSGRGERWVEGIFGLHARHHGNGMGYDTIAAAGDHANTLHWIRNDGVLRNGDMILLDAGVETDALYTADITRTLPISGTFSPEQRMIYNVVLAAQDAGIAACKPGNTFSDIHKAAIAVIVDYLDQWGLLPVSKEQTLSAEGGEFRRWMVHG
ncbi:MAG: aminopeptidase P family protein, partial [Propionibacteriaceae bacterium]